MTLFFFLMELSGLFIIPGVSKGCFLEVFKYLASKKQPAPLKPLVMIITDLIFSLYLF